METITEEDDKEVKMYERESIMMRQNLKLNLDEDKNIRESKESNNDYNPNESFKESKTFQVMNRFTQLNDSLFNAVEEYQEENEKESNNNNEEDNNNNNNDNINNNNDKNDNNEININADENNINENNDDKDDENNDEKNDENQIIITKKPKRENLKEYKIIVLGDFGVGKSSLIYRYLNNKFKKDIPEESPNPENNMKIIQIDENTKVKLNIWDTAGQEKCGKIIRKYYIDIYGALVVFDLTNKESFEHLNNWLNDLKENAPKDVINCFVGNKSDLVEERKISYEEIKEFLQDNLYYEVSTKNGNNVSLAFEQLAYNIFEKQIEEENNPDKVVRGSEGRKTTNLKPFNNENELNKKKACC